MNEKIAVVGLGYVGLPLLVALSRQFPGVTGFDINPRKIEALKSGQDVTGTFSAEEIRSCRLFLTSDPETIEASFIIVAVPTPVDRSKHPDLSFLLSASEIVGGIIRPGAIVVFESTVYPGVTEDICGPALAKASGLRCGVDFKLGYSPERINPGDAQHTLERVTKVVSAQDAESLLRVAEVYSKIAARGVFRAKSIRVAEAAKVIENIQRDVNIALMNELSIIFHLLGVETKDVLSAAATKWNFLTFAPGLVGGHCIGVDPYYLTTKAEELGYQPQVILSGRRVNDGMGILVAHQAVRMLAKAGKNLRDSHIAILGITFKENVNDIRNSRVPDIIRELRSFGAQPIVTDPLADSDLVEAEYDVRLSRFDAIKDIDCLIIAVAHSKYKEMDSIQVQSLLRRPGIVLDVKGIFESGSFPGGYFLLESVVPPNRGVRGEQYL